MSNKKVVHQVNEVLGVHMLKLAGRLYPNAWVRRAFINNDHQLTIFLLLGAVCKEWYDAVEVLPETAALRLAKAQFVQLKKRSISPYTSRARKRDMALIMQMYESAVSLFSCSWLLQDELEERLRCARLENLSIIDLQSIYGNWKGAWGFVEIELLVSPESFHLLQENYP